jgi:hypothetical protein
MTAAPTHPERLTRREREIMNAIFALGNRASAEAIRAKMPHPPGDSAVRIMLARVARPPRFGAALPMVGLWPCFAPRQRTPAGAQGVSTLPRFALGGAAGEGDSDCGGGAGGGLGGAGAVGGGAEFDCGGGAGGALAAAGGGAAGGAGGAAALVETGHLGRGRPGDLGGRSGGVSRDVSGRHGRGLAAAAGSA